MLSNLASDIPIPVSAIDNHVLPFFLKQRTYIRPPFEEGVNPCIIAFSIRGCKTKAV